MTGAINFQESKLVTRLLGFMNWVKFSQKLVELTMFMEIETLYVAVLKCQNTSNSLKDRIELVPKQLKMYIKINFVNRTI